VAAMTSKPTLTLLCALAFTLSEAQAAGLVPIEWTADGQFAKELTVPGKKFVEACGKLAAGAKVDWSFEAGAPMDFNIHFHAGKEVRYPAKEKASFKSSGTLEAKVEQDYCWMWTSSSAGEASLKLQLKRR
jgi:hypothetical protein